MIISYSLFLVRFPWMALRHNHSTMVARKPRTHKRISTARKNWRRAGLAVVWQIKRLMIVVRMILMAMTTRAAKKRVKSNSAMIKLRTSLNRAGRAKISLRATLSTTNPSQTTKTSRHKTTTTNLKKKARKMTKKVKKTKKVNMRAKVKLQTQVSIKKRTAKFRTKKRRKRKSTAFRAMR